MSLLKSAETPLNKLKIDHIGLILLVIWIGALQLMLDLGHEHDWFHSNIINSLAAVAIAGFIVFLIWEITEHNPIVNVRVFRHRGFTISVLALSFGFGAFLAVLC